MPRAVLPALALLATGVLAQPAAPTPWVIPPAELKGLKSPVSGAVALAASVKRGAALYAKECAGCHGETGGGDGPDAMYYVPPPPKLKGLKLPDAEVFVKVSKGRDNMKGMEEKLDAAQRWDLVSFVQSLR